MEISRKDFRYYTNTLFEKDFYAAIAKWVAITALWFFLRYNGDIGWKSIIESMGCSLALNFLWYAMKYSIAKQVELTVEHIFDKLPRMRVTIQEQALVDVIRDARPLWIYYTELLSQLTERMPTLMSGQKVEVDPYAIYSHILSCASSCTCFIDSVDCDLEAWYYVCEIEDLEKLYKSHPDKGCIVDTFIKERKQRMRLDFTYRLSRIFCERLSPNADNPISGRLPLRRVFIIHKDEKDLSIKDKLIILRIQNLQRSTKGRMENRVVFLPNIEHVDDNIRTALRTLQDVIIFEKKVAFKEYLLERDIEIKESGEIIINEKEIERLEKAFNFIFKDAKDIMDITVEDTANAEQNNI